MLSAQSRGRDNFVVSAIHTQKQGNGSAMVHSPHTENFGIRLNILQSETISLGRSRWVANVGKDCRLATADN
jgi:hypothetical protein